MSPAAEPDPNAKITPDDIEAKFRAIQGEVEIVGGEAMNKAIIVGAVVVTVVVVVAFALGRRRGTKRRTVVEIRRI